MDPHSLRHLNGLREFVRNLVEQAERSAGCECHRPPSLLLVGPPGAGKTYLVKQMSSACDMPLFGVHTHQLSGPSSLRSLFGQARELDYPSLFFMDDLDFIFRNHDSDRPLDSLRASLRDELYQQLGPRKLKIFDKHSERNPVKNSLPNTPQPSARLAPRQSPGEEEEDEDDPDNNGLILVAATSSPWLLYKDHELLSRFRGVYLVGLPDRETRFHMLKILLQKVQHNLTEKELWIVADKTQGFTPSDLMIITKSLNYEQFSFLFSMAGLNNRYGEGRSSDEDSLSSSDDLTETDMDSNYDTVDDPSESVKRIIAQSLNLSRKGDQTTPSQSSSSSRKTSVCSYESSSKTVLNASAGVVKKDWAESSRPRPRQDTTIGLIEKDWEEEEEKEKTSEQKDAQSSEGKTPENVPPSSEGQNPSAPREGDSNEGEVRAPPSPLPPCESAPPSVSSDCDNSSNVTNSDVSQGPRGPLVSPPSPVSDPASPSSPVGDATPPAPSPSPQPPSDDEEKAFELHVFHPPSAFPHDNQAVDSDSDNESGGGDFCKRALRVNFCSASSMQPLSVEVGHSDALGGGYEPNVSLSPGMADTLLSKDPYCGPSADTILKRLLSSSPDLHDRLREDDINSKNARNKEGGVSPLPKGDAYHQDDYMDVYPCPDPIDVDEPDSCRKEKDFRRNSLSEDRHSLPEGSPRLSGVSPQLTGGGITPTGSVTSSHLATDNSSDSGSGRHIHMGTPPAGGEMNKTQDSDSSLYGKSETPTIPSSDISTATCNVSGETLACHSDSDERLRHLEEDLKSRRPRSSASEDDEGEDDGEDLSEEESDDEALQRIFKLNNLGEISIKILTINDVLKVVNKTPKSVSDEEIKRYTDFMVWFADVAKSACPHNSKGTLSDTASSVDMSVNSSLWSQSPSTKKRKGPLRKLGRFLLKALMFILD